MALLNADSYSRSQYRLANGNTQKHDNHGGGQAMLSPKDHGTRCAIGLLCTLEHKTRT